MAIPTLKNKHICQVLGTGIASVLEDMLRAGATTYHIAGAMGTSEDQMQKLLDGPDPLPERPLNWAASPGTGPAQFPWAGVATIAWTGIEGGYTYGPPLFAEAVYTTTAYPTQFRVCPPLNWTATNQGTCAIPGPFFGLVSVAYTGKGWPTHPTWNPATPGFTFGTPVAGR